MKIAQTSQTTRESFAQWLGVRPDGFIANTIAFFLMLTFLGISVGVIGIVDMWIQPEAERVISVQPGDTLWSIAESVNSESPATTVSHIRQLNDLPNQTIVVGQELILPSR